MALLMAWTGLNGCLSLLHGMQVVNEMAWNFDHGVCDQLEMTKHPRLGTYERGTRSCTETRWGKEMEERDVTQ